MTKKARTISRMRRGWTTAFSSAMRGGVLALSQRVGELRADGLCILDKWVETDSGARVKAYRILSPTKWTA